MPLVLLPVTQPRKAKSAYFFSVRIGVQGISLVVDTQGLEPGTNRL